MDKQAFLEKLQSTPQDITFDDTMAVIDAHYTFTPTSFRNGASVNEAGQNNGSCKILAFGMLNDLSAAQTLACFGRFYREDVLGNLSGDDHQNIRNFMKTGWDEVNFDGTPLTEKSA